MYFWKINELKNDITTGNFGEKDRFIYAFICIALGSLGMEAMMCMPVENPNIWDIIGSIGNIVIPVAGTFFAYKINGANKGTDFLGRFFSISFVVSIRFLVLLLPIFVVLLFYYIKTFPEEEIVSTPIDVIPFQLWLIFLYVRVCKHIGDIKSS